jgi:predicted GNAT superfamily acetyltransferase
MQTRNMEKEFIPYEQALALKELGFDEPCFGYYKYEELLIQGQSKNSDHGFSISAPLYQQAFRWFREKYQIDSWIYPNLNGLYSVSNVRRGVGLGKVSEYQTYEEAELECLKQLIEIVKNG